MNPETGRGGGNDGQGYLGIAADFTALVWLGLAFTAFSIVPARALFSVYLGDPNYSHGFLVPLVALLLAWRARTRYVLAERGRGPRGLIPLALGCGLVVLGQWYQIALRPGYLGHVFLQSVGLWIALTSIVWILAGRSRFWILAPVLGFLFFAVPWPESFLLPLTTILQRFVAICSALLLRALGVEVFRDGNVLQLRSAVLGVAEACSGIRSLMAFFATAAACAVFLSLGVWRTLLLFVLAPVAAVGSNIIRILVTSIFVLLGGDVWIHGVLHDLLGLAVVILGGGFLFASARFLSRGAPRHAGATPSTEPPAQVTRLWPVAGVAGLLLFGATLTMLHMVRHYETMVRPDVSVPVVRLPLADFPYTIGQYRCTDESRLSSGEVDNLQPSDHLVRTYEDPESNALRLTLLYWEAQRTYPGSTALARYPHDVYGCMQGAGWARASLYDSQTNPEWLADGSLFTAGFEKAGRERVVVFWNNKPIDYPRPFSPKDLRQRWRLLVESWTKVPEDILPATYGVRIEIDIENQPAKARDIALDFARQAAEVLPGYGIGNSSEPRW